MKSVRKAVIPAAGLGTRFLPATKSVPKELLTLVDRPILLYIVEECVRAGIEDIVLIAGRGKGAIEDFFDCSYELEDQLNKSGKSDLLNKIKDLKNMANMISIRQKQALGLGHAVACAEPIVGDEPFVVLLGDEVMINAANEPTVSEQLVRVYEQHGMSSVGVMEVPESEVHKYGIIEKEDLSEGQYKVKSVVEKPAAEKAPSRLALPGRYLFTGKIFGHLRDTPAGKNGEIQLTDGMTALAKDEGMVASLFQARRYDAGDKLGYLQANVELALEHPEMGAAFRNYLKDLAPRL